MGKPPQEEMTAKKYNTKWDLSPLFKSDTDPKIKSLRASVIKKSYEFIDKWKTRSDFLEDPKVLKEALDEYNEWLENYGAAHQENHYFELRYALDQTDTKLRAAINKVDEISKKIQNDIQFFELRLSKLKPDVQKEMLAYPELSPYRHFLEKIFAVSPHILTDPEEKIMNLKSTSSYENWVKMTSSFITRESAEVIDEREKPVTVSFSQLLGLMNSQVKPVRDKAAQEFNKILLKNADVAENEINSILLDKKVNDELRGYEKPFSSRLLADDIDENMIKSLLESVEANFSVSERFYRLKAQLLGVKKLAYHERNVEYGKVDKKYTFEEGVGIIGRTFKNLDGEFLKIFDGFVKNGRVDVYPATGKASGAFCTYGLIIHPVYILLNWNDKLNDVQTFAHELGHGINDELVKKSQNALNFGTPVSTAEVASTFMEDFVLQELLKSADDELKLSLMMMKLNEDISSIFRQVAFFRFENELHITFRERGYLSKDEIGKLFQKHMASYMGTSVEQSAGSENWWVYWNHLRYFFYVYSYASGLLISKSLQASVKKNPEFIIKVKDFLSTGLSASPKQIFSKLGIDIQDKKFWLNGIEEINSLLEDTEKLAKKLKKIKN